MEQDRKLNFVTKLAYKSLSFHDIDNITLRRAVRHFSRTVEPGARVLDAGAGLKPYAEYFQHCRYESADFAECEEFFSNLDDGTRSALLARHTYICPLNQIPVAPSSFDYILCTQVLEHVAHPSEVLREFHRVLKAGGQVFITVPQGYGIHGEPYNFFYFTRYGLKLLLEEAGYQVRTIEERGGYFFYLYDRLSYAIPRIVFGYRKWMLVVMLALLPIHALLAYVLGPLLLLLEPLDKEKRFTLGYISLASKTNEASLPSDGYSAGL